MSEQIGRNNRQRVIAALVAIPVLTAAAACSSRTGAVPRAAVSGTTVFENPAPNPPTLDSPPSGVETCIESTDLTNTIDQAELKNMAFYGAIKTEIGVFESIAGIGTITVQAAYLPDKDTQLLHDLLHEPQDATVGVSYIFGTPVKQSALPHAGGKGDAEVQGVFQAYTTVNAVEPLEPYIPYGISPNAPCADTGGIAPQ